MALKLRTLLTLLSTTIFLGSCGGEDSNPAIGSGTQTLKGAVAFDSGQDGTIEITIPDTLNAGRLGIRTQTSSNIDITGQCIYPTGSVSLTGGINPETGSFTLTGSGYTFTGVFDVEKGTFTGTVASESGLNGSVSGVNSTENEVLIFCGNFTTEESGVWVLTVTDSEASGSYAGTESTDSLIGTRSGNTITVRPVNTPDEGYAQGTISGNSVSGNIYDSLTGEISGSFQGSTEGCL